MTEPHPNLSPHQPASAGFFLTGDDPMPTITVTTLRKIAPGADAKMLATLAPALDSLLPAGGIDTPLRQAHFLAQAAHETGGFRTLEEYGGPSYFARYDGRKDLGNLQPGDGARFHGRGIFQLTGRVNYQAYGKRLGIDLVNNPALAASPTVSVRIAVAYWKAKGLNVWADRDDVVEITRRINGGRNGLADRRRYLTVAKQQLCANVVGLMSADAALAGDAADDILDEEIPDAPIAADPTKRWWESNTVRGSLLSAIPGILAAMQSPWGIAAIFAIPIAVGCAIVIYRRLSRDPA
jgi:putative chitinase